MTITDVHPVIEGRLLSKMGRACIKGTWQDKTVKIFECASARHAEFIANEMMHGACSEYFPQVHATHQQFVIAEWVHGRQITPHQFVSNASFVAQLEEFLELLHGTSPEASSDFDYVEETVRARFVRCCQALGLAAFQEKIEQSWDVMRHLAGQKTVSHPDLTPDNMIITDHGQLKIIDNELLGVSQAPWFDQLNILFALRSLSVEKTGKLRAFLDPLLEIIRAGYNEQLLGMWLMRVTGSRFIAGDIKGVLELAATPMAKHSEEMAIWKTLRAGLKEDEHSMFKK